uniref:Uncharacterized protein n=1 Tax=Plectus sambesii TaxID=2011161 RepID=A0A914UPN9_9BILA
MVKLQTDFAQSAGLWRRRVPLEKTRDGTAALPVRRQGSHSFSAKHPTFSSCRYEGGWIDAKPHGSGKLYWPDGRMYIGRFRDGVIQGIYQQAFEKRRKNLVERDEIARSYLRQAHIKRGIENGIVYPSEEDLGHILKQDIDDQALLRAETQRPREIREEERWMTAVMRDQRR